ncbi:hypothetical protein AB1Y20_004344 [Prymnesium parvum]|uniref:tRNA (guanine-N(7)-)-methyltransferase n=1 Tax=Prymnesium parvum TaxID=97485 RepID=A0AB34IYL4_PRYPA
MAQVRRRSSEEPAAPPSEAAEGSDAPARPQKKFFRTRAHSNVLNANDFWFPASPTAVPLHEYFPSLCPSPSPAAPHVEMVDVGCGYGSLLLELARLFPTQLILGIEIRPKVVEYVQRKVLALRHEAREPRAAAAAAAAAAAVAMANPETAGARHASRARDGSWLTYDNVWAVHNNAMRFLPNFFQRGQLTKLFFCFADPHFKRKNHRKRVITPALLAEYAFVLKPAGLVYCITDVAELMTWMVGHLSSSPLFERLDNAALQADPTVPILIQTDEGLKVMRNNGNMYIAVYRKRLDPLAPLVNVIPNDNAIAAQAAADAGYTPKPGGEKRGMTW